MWDKRTFANFFFSYFRSTSSFKVFQTKCCSWFLKVLKCTENGILCSNFFTYLKKKSNYMKFFFLRKFFLWSWKYIPFSQEIRMIFISEGTSVAIFFHLHIPSLERKYTFHFSLQLFHFCSCFLWMYKENIITVASHCM